ncbi:MAG: (2Fe-2S)-binding protein [Candidatus Brocadiae bacterium]|nr:(2Fe-2S)-binding protein [Candidatus Brocadiia bacterium]
MNGFQKQEIEFTINGKRWSGRIHPMKRLLDAIREDVGLKGTKEGCGEGECGACTVLLDGKPVMSCIVPVCQVHGHEIITIEGLEEAGKLHPLQESFLRDGGAQCGICTPGMILSATAYYNDPRIAKDLTETISGNLCRCTGYTKIFSACQHAMEKRECCCGEKK